MTGIPFFYFVEHIFCFYYKRCRGIGQEVFFMMKNSLQDKTNKQDMYQHALFVRFVSLSGRII